MEHSKRPPPRGRQPDEETAAFRGSAIAAGAFFIVLVFVAPVALAFEEAVLAGADPWRRALLGRASTGAFFVVVAAALFSFDAACLDPPPPRTVRPAQDDNRDNPATLGVPNN
jgi:hypothetical protein